MAQVDDLGVDDFYFSALMDEDERSELFPVSDDKYAEKLQFQEALLASSITSHFTNDGSPQNFKPISPSSLNPPFSPPKSNLAPDPHPETDSGSNSDSELEIVAYTVQTGQCSQVFRVPERSGSGESSQIMCEICVEGKKSDQMFKSTNGCLHSFCSDCISKHVATKIQENITTVLCPAVGCGGVLELDSCRPLLPKELLERWNEALCEVMLLGASKIYCPFKDCSAVLVVENEEAIRESECPECHRLFCAQCNVPWHSEVGCEEFQQMNEDERGSEDLMVKKLANEKKWGRCPKCKFYVEKTQGCLHITCRCRFEFCYACGAQWNETHGGCQPN